MRIVFGWNRIKLKSFTFQELNLPELEQFPNAKFQVVQSYFHIFWIPVFPLGKRYDLVMNKQSYHVPPSIMKLIDQEQIRVSGKWYAWLLPILAIVFGLGAYFSDMYDAHKTMESEIAYAASQRAQFDHPEVGDGIRFSDHRDLDFEGEVMEVSGSRVKLLIDLTDQLDEELLANIEKGISTTNADTLRMIINDRNNLVNTSIYRDSLLAAHPDQPIFRKLLAFELEKFPIRYEIIEMPVAEYKSMKKSIGDGYTTFIKSVKLPSLKAITKYRLYVSPAEF